MGQGHGGPRTARHAVPTLVEHDPGRGVPSRVPVGVAWSPGSPRDGAAGAPACVGLPARLGSPIRAGGPLILRGPLAVKEKGSTARAPGVYK
jgi:hypothetical protein